MEDKVDIDEIWTRNVRPGQIAGKYFVLRADDSTNSQFFNGQSSLLYKLRQDIFSPGYFLLKYTYFTETIQITEETVHLKQRHYSVFFTQGNTTLHYLAVHISIFFSLLDCLTMFTNVRVYVCVLRHLCILNTYA